MLQKLPIIGVMGSHSDEWPELAEPLGEFIATSGYHLLTGAGGGVMQSAAKGFSNAKSRKGHCIGVYPLEDGRYADFGNKDLYPNEFIEIPIAVPLNNKAMSHIMPFSRNIVNIMSSDLVIALPGWHGTKAESSLALQLDKPLIFFGPEESFETFPDAPNRVQTLEDIQNFIEQQINPD